MLISANEKQGCYDLIVIGGGINGAAIARDAALRGLKVLLLEKMDFGSGASTKTSKLAHGGLRYLDQFEFGLVKESLEERNLLLKNAPHLVRPLKFTFPVYKNSRRSLFQINLGLYLYDFLARKGNLPRHTKLSKNEVITLFPSIKSHELEGACAYFDAQMKDNRLIMENILAAKSAGAEVFNYAEVIQFIWDNDRIKGVIYNHQNENVEIACRSVVNATGAWSNHLLKLEKETMHPLVAPSKGVHIVVPKMFESGLILTAPQDNRVFFILPWEGNSLIGATDTFYDASPETATVTELDIDYLLEAVKCYFPQSNINRSSIISSFVGLRPLVAHKDFQNPSLMSRDHLIHFSQSGLVTVLGGKYTTHRQIAEEVVDKLTAQFPQTFNNCSTKETPLPGAFKEANELKIELENIGLNKLQIDHLLQNYGLLTKFILEIIQNNSSELKQISPNYPHIFAEVTYGILYEHVKHVDDWLYRRTSFAYLCAKDELEEIKAKIVDHVKDR